MPAITAGRPARLHSAKTLALLAYLILEADMSHSRGKLAGLLWGESPDARARQSFRQAVYSLRRVLGKECLAIEESAVIFEPPPDFWVDALEFHSKQVSGKSMRQTYILLSTTSRFSLTC